MAKVFVLGIDSLDRELIEAFLPDLPNFSRLAQETGALRATSVLPPDSATAWPTIYTGLNPARHGLVYFVDPLDKVNSTVNFVVDNSFIRGASFWDHAGRAGRKVVVLFPHVGYPAWEVNGILAVRDEKAGVIEARPEDLPRRYRMDDLMVLQGLPTTARALASYVAKGERLIEREAELTLEVAAAEPWDLLFTYSSVMDWVSHNFWSHHDPNDPAYAGDANPHRNVLRGFYERYDAVLGRYLAALPEDAVMMVMSDHGHGLRPPLTFNLNEHLRRRGLFVLNGDGGDGDRPGRRGSGVLDALRKRGASFVNGNRWTWNLAMRAIKVAPPLRRLYTSPPTIDWSRTLAYAADQSGIKAYNYGGVMVNRARLDEAAYERLRDDLIADLRSIRAPGRDEPLFRWVSRREDVYPGPHIAKYPDVCFEMLPGYGAGWGTDGALFGRASAHNIQPGSHRRDTPVLLFGNLRGRAVVRERAELMDVAPTILALLGVPLPEGLDGSPVVASGDVAAPAGPEPPTPAVSP